MTVKCIMWCCSVFQMNGFCQVKSTLTVILCSVCMEQWTLSRDPVIWNAARSPSGVMPSACGESRCTVGGQRGVRLCLSVKVAVWGCVITGIRDSFHYKQMLHYGTDYITEGSTDHCCVTETTKPYGTNHCSRVHDRLWCVFSVVHSDKKKKVKIPLGIDDRWPPRLSREKRRQTKRWRNRGERKH